MNPVSSPATDAGRVDVTFRSGDGQCAAWLYRPDDVERPPIIVMAHGFGAIRLLRLDAYAERFVGSGYAVLVFDYRHFGDSPGQPRELLSIARQQQDWRAAIAAARSLPGVDTSRVIAWGSSLGGGHVLHTAARDRTLAAVIAQVPHVSGLLSTFTMGPAHIARLIGAGLRDEAGHLLGRPPFYVPSIADTGTFAVMVADDAMDTLRRLGEGLDADRFLPQNRVAGRILLRVPFYSPGRGARRITAPTLIQAGEHDELTPTAASLKVARRIPRAEFKAYPCGHFDPYVDPHFDNVIDDQLRFLHTHVPVERSAQPS